MNKFIAAIASGALAMGAMAAPAFANTITVNGTGGTTIDCSPSCQGFIGGGSPADPTGPGTLSDDFADLYDGTPSSVADELSDLNTLAGTSFVAGDHNKLEPAPALPYMTTALYIALKLGNQVVYLFNNSGGTLTIDVTTTSGFGLSHLSEIGELDVPDVPVPGAIWLMGAGLAGLGFSGRKKKA